MKNFCVITLLTTFIIASCSHSARRTKNNPDTVENIKGVEFRLEQTSKKCLLIYGSPSKSILLKLPHGCRFHRNKQGDVRVVTLNNDHIFLLESSQPNQKFPGDCDTRIQGVKITPQKITVSETISKVAACPPFQWDEKMFICLFE